MHAAFTQRRRAAAALLLAVVLAHAVALWLWQRDAAPRPVAAAVRAALQTRQIAAPRSDATVAAAAPGSRLGLPQHAVVAPAAAPAGTPAVPFADREPGAPERRTAADRLAAAGRQAAVERQVTAERQPAAERQAAAERQPAAERQAAAERQTAADAAPPPSTAAAPAPSGPAAAAAADTRPPPVYATRLPPSAQLRYTLRRGGVIGSAELRWMLADDARYHLQLDGAAADGTPLLAWDSTGSIDTAGVAPDRFVDRRRRRGAMAVNFQRDRGLITFSGPQLQLPLVPGAQDRASWLVQLAAVVAADPARFVPGTHIEVFVAGARGDGEGWVFGVDAVEPLLDLPAGPVLAALRLRREPTRPYDTRAEIWLDPARAHLPVRVRLQRVPGGADDTTELLLQHDSAPGTTP